MADLVPAPQANVETFQLPTALERRNSVRRGFEEREDGTDGALPELASQLSRFLRLHSGRKTALPRTALRRLTENRELALAWGVLTHNLWVLARMRKVQKAKPELKLAA